MHMFAGLLHLQPSTTVEPNLLLASNPRIRTEQDGTGLRFDIVVLHNDRHFLLTPCDRISFNVSHDIYKPFSTFLTSFHRYAMALPAVSRWKKYICEESHTHRKKNVQGASLRLGDNDIPGLWRGPVQGQHPHHVDV